MEDGVTHLVKWVPADPLLCLSLYRMMLRHKVANSYDVDWGEEGSLSLFVTPRFGPYGSGVRWGFHFKKGDRESFKVSFLPNKPTTGFYVLVPDWFSEDLWEDFIDYVGYFWEALEEDPIYDKFKTPIRRYAPVFRKGGVR